MNHETNDQYSISFHVDFGKAMDMNINEHVSLLIHENWLTRKLITAKYILPIYVYIERQCVFVNKINKCWSINQTEMKNQEQML